MARGRIAGALWMLYHEIQGVSALVGGWELCEKRRRALLAVRSSRYPETEMRGKLRNSEW